MVAKAFRPKYGEDFDDIYTLLVTRGLPVSDFRFFSPSRVSQRF